MAEREIEKKKNPFLRLPNDEKDSRETRKQQEERDTIVFVAPFRRRCVVPARTKNCSDTRKRRRRRT